MKSGEKEVKSKSKTVGTAKFEIFDSPAEALATLVAQPDLRRSMGARSRQLAEQEHDTDANCHKLFDLMDRIALPAPSGGARLPDHVA